ncbi:zinc finger protein VAR3, chloroplastic-like [Zingiber officinale]|uniref:RanBP2-type domain-containing protein n=1 Tax=Zingiber officinale TaxID=94328 RepID=A0A8J5KNB1_ZINOF|nr:zinc finger protein VAR3, chloroplastic-like [Zingiber officinale]XP_042414109.1 zinc finger protein VAR3, chloroplastic-like [Zingiber officinale]KAG6494281.1 hypothetical protein ZIOFF_049304 [Zingiber officinale]
MGGASRLLLILSTPFPRPPALRLVRHPAFSYAAVSSVHCRRFLPCPARLRLGFSSSAASVQLPYQVACARDGFSETLVSTPTFLANAFHPWPEWSNLLDYLRNAGYFSNQAPLAIGDDDDSLVTGEYLTEELVKTAQACLSFARDRSHFIRFLNKKDIEIIVENGSPFLFKNGAHSTRRLQSFLRADGAEAQDSEVAQTVDIMRYLVSFACSIHATSDANSLRNRDLVCESTQTLLAELVNLVVRGPGSGLNEAVDGHNVMRHDQFPRPTGQNVQMKRGDWICPKCTFMNFARNVRCLECNESRPKRVLTGGEWECPQCDFFNYGRNMSCLRCDCKRPVATPLETEHSAEQILNRSGIDKSEIERKLAANDEKTERWFNKMSQLNDSADLSDAVADEDFPEIMPMQKGMNRFVVSTRKTPLERRLANNQNNGRTHSSSSEGNQLQQGASVGMGSRKTYDSVISETLDRIFGRTSTSSSGEKPVSAGGIDSGSGNRSSFSEYKDQLVNHRTDPDYVPFVPLPEDTFAKPQKGQSSNSEGPIPIESRQTSDSLPKGTESSAEGKGSEYSDSSKSFTQVSELDNQANAAYNQANAALDNFPEIMPLRKGENRFVVSKKKDRSLSSPQYKRRVAMEQANNSNFVPFVPFPPDYFAKKDKQPEVSKPVASASEGSSALGERPLSVTEKSKQADGNTTNWSSTQTYHESSNMNSNNYEVNPPNTKTSYSAGLPNNSRYPGDHSWNQYNGPNISASPQQTELSGSTNEGWKPNFTGKSLEGSCVTEPDPLDMSEEAKAARWFRRAAQIKDISELSNIPDEDFPEIMPMRKGVNRFVVSKRKTPLERRLTSPQYRRNLPIIKSEPDTDANE